MDTVIQKPLDTKPPWRRDKTPFSLASSGFEVRLQGLSQGSATADFVEGGNMLVPQSRVPTSAKGQCKWIPLVLLLATGNLEATPSKLYKVLDPLTGADFGDFQDGRLVSQNASGCA